MARPPKPLTKAEKAFIRKNFTKLKISQLAETMKRDCRLILDFARSAGLIHEPERKYLELDDGRGYLNLNCLKVIGPDASWIA